RSIVAWSVFCAATRRRMRPNLDWDPFFEVAREDLPYRERLRRYAAIARERLEEEPFRDFCAAHLPQLDEVVWEFFGSPEAREAVRLKVQALFPSHEVDTFTEVFW